MSNKRTIKNNSKNKNIEELNRFFLPQIFKFLEGSQISKII